MYRTNHGVISSYIPFPSKRRFQLKINFYTRLSNAPRRRYPLVIWYRRVYGQEDRIMALPDRERTSTISSAVWIQYSNVTDGRTPADNKDCSSASRCKMYNYGIPGFPFDLWSYTFATAYAGGGGCAGEHVCCEIPSVLRH